MAIQLDILIITAPGAEIRWKAKVYSLTEAQRRPLPRRWRSKQERKPNNMHNMQKVAQAIKELLAIAPSANADHPYLQDKTQSRTD